MKLSALSCFLPAIASFVVACSTTAEPVATVPVAPPVGTGPVAVEVDAGSDSETPVPVRKGCSTPLVALECARAKPAPVTREDVNAFLEEGAIPLRCDAKGKEKERLWDFQPLVDLYGSNKIFMMGEVHGTNEIGIVSALVFEQLAAKGLVNIVASELPMDYEPFLQRYVDEGDDAFARQVLDGSAPNFFGTTLTEAARTIVEGGKSLRVAAVDIPLNPRSAADVIQVLATKLSSHKATVLATLPTNPSQPPSGADMSAADAYFDLVIGKKQQICTELSVADCERLIAMTHALWASTLTYDDVSDSELWFERREEVIYFNLRSKMGAPADRMYLHMGAAHTDKFTFSAGSRMTHEHAFSKDRVFSVAPAYGSGSVIWYGQDMTLPGSPPTVVRSLTDSPAHPLFVPTVRPNASCQDNPLGKELEDMATRGGTRGESYDGYLHYGNLTSEMRPGDTKLSRSTPVADATTQSNRSRSLQSFRARIDRKERAAIAARAARTAKLRH